MRAIWRKVYEIPNAQRLRLFLAGLMIANGIGYLQIYLSQSPLTTSFLYQTRFLPMWGYVVMFLALGLATGLTAKHRATYAGRMVAVVGLAVYFTMGTMWYATFTFTAVYRVAIVSLALLLEFAHTDPPGV